MPMLPTRVTRAMTLVDMVDIHYIQRYTSIILTV